MTFGRHDSLCDELSLACYHKSARRLPGFSFSRSSRFTSLHISR